MRPLSGNVATVFMREQSKAVSTPWENGELAASANGDDLARWTAALGFCDLVSLSLLSGLSGVELPLAHPASPQAQTAPKVRMHVTGRILRFTPGVVRAGTSLSIQALKHPVPPSIIAAVIRNIIESGTWKLRHPCGPDAEPFLAWRAAMTDEQWVDFNALDAEGFRKRVKNDNTKILLCQAR